MSAWNEEALGGAVGAKVKQESELSLWMVFVPIGAAREKRLSGDVVACERDAGEDWHSQGKPGMGALDRSMPLLLRF